MSRDHHQGRSLVAPSDPPVRNSGSPAAGRSVNLLPECRVSTRKPWPQRPALRADVAQSIRHAERFSLARREAPGTICPGLPPIHRGALPLTPFSAAAAAAVAARSEPEAMRPHRTPPMGTVGFVRCKDIRTGKTKVTGM
ncbi:unnamed protein product [Lampetra fluviatilis]